MAHNLVAKHTEMRGRAANTKCINLRQATMTHEFDAVADHSATIEPLPPGYIQIWDNPGGKYYYYNKDNKDIHLDLAHVHAKVALDALNASNAERSEKEDQENENVPDAVASASVTPSPVKSEFISSKYNTPPHTSYGGTVSLLSSDDEDEDDIKESDEDLEKIRQELEDTSSSSGSSTDLDRKPAPVYKPAVVYKRLYKRRKKGQNAMKPKKIKMSPVASMPPSHSQNVVDQADNDGSDESNRDLGSVQTQDLPNTEDFGGAEALVTLQTEPACYEEDE